MNKMKQRWDLQAPVQKPATIDLPKSRNVAASYPLTTFILGQFGLKEAQTVSSMLLVSVDQKQTTKRL